MTTYKYTPINLEEPSFRLVRLNKGWPSDDIHCEIFHAWRPVSKDDNPYEADAGVPYEALSYTWGSTETNAKITANGCIMSITENLYVALQHIRSKTEDRILWIDAICIDQTNLKERGHQVRQMGKIYHDATNVIIWLGKATSTTDFAMKSTEALHRKVIHVGGDWRSSIELWTRWVTGGDTTWTDAKPILCEGYRDLLSRPWFERVWVLQEVANARKATIACGERTVSARTFALLPSLLELDVLGNCQAVLDLMPGISRETSWWSKAQDLHTLLIKFRESKSTDPRDHVYALLGISSDAESNKFLYADYEKNIEQVVHDVILFFLPIAKLNQFLHRFIRWTMPTLLSHLTSLRSALLEEALLPDQMDISVLLLEDGANIPHGKQNHIKLLMAAIKEKNYNIVKLLLDKGADVNAHGRQGMRNVTPLLSAIEGCQDNIIKLLLDKGANVNAQGMQGWWKTTTPLLSAIERNQEDLIKVFLDKGADVDTQGEERTSPLFFAIKRNQDNVVKILLDKGADVNTQGTGKTSPLLFAIKRNQDNIVKLLLDEGADVNKQGKGITTPLLSAIDRNQDNIVKLLLENGVNIDIQHWSGKIPLLLVVERNQENIVQVLLGNGADVITQGITTPLLSAIDRNQDKNVKLLLDKGAKINVWHWRGDITDLSVIKEKLKKARRGVRVWQQKDTTG
ncbi:hypothetical protein BP6252_10849 [Coleophoma cylindrospora]|uniref:Heterokaryon incompatibility domain-containing protein n=1 Tax=Coleophoma cylindrospora TaxID=1849047 RepID=A0A3D8QPC9_9HELO|nr:hypothetical protein BP6252_10849 [Coleophoma cylindrospora]